MRNLLLTLRFNGAAYCGWQVQKNGVSVQQTLQDAIETVFGRREAVTGCSRTDSGVHANMYCCNFRTEKPLDCGRMVFALNANLPDDIAVTDCREVPETFHARYSCRSKEYIYRILNSRVRDPFLNGLCLRADYPMDERGLDRAAKMFVGTHDFAGFASAGGSAESTVRTVLRAEVSRSGDEVVFSVEADGFLYNMVRIMTGTLLYIAQGKIDADDLPGIVASGRREAAGITAPAHGLYLNKVKYN